MNKSVNCKYGCQGTGVVVYRGKRVPCPEHGIDMEEKILGTETIQGKSLEDYLRIPQEYTDYWVSNIDDLFKDSNLVYLTDNSISKLKAILHEIYSTLVDKNTLLGESFYFYSSMLDLNKFFYTIQKIALDKRKSTAPIISVNELSSLLKVEQYTLLGDYKSNYNYLKQVDKEAWSGYILREKIGLSYYDYFDSDLVIIRDTALSSNKSLEKLRGFVEERGFTGRITHVVSSVYPNFERVNLISNGRLSQKLTKLTEVSLQSKKTEEETQVEKPKTNKSDKDSKKSTFDITELFD